MITINLRYLAYVFWFVSICLLIHGLFMFAMTIHAQEIAFMIYAFIVARDVIISLLCWGIGYLFWRAFRPQS